MPDLLDDPEAARWAMAEANATIKRHRHTLWGLVHNAPNAGTRDDLCNVPLWAAVMRLTGEGSTVSHRLCREFGADPDELTPAPPVEEEEDDDEIDRLTRERDQAQAELKFTTDMTRREAREGRTHHD